MQEENVHNSPTFGMLTQDNNRNTQIKQIGSHNDDSHCIIVSSNDNSYCDSDNDNNITTDEIERPTSKNSNKSHSSTNSHNNVNNKNKNNTTSRSSLNSVRFIAGATEDPFYAASSSAYAMSQNSDAPTTVNASRATDNPSTRGQSNYIEEHEDAPGYQSISAMPTFSEERMKRRLQFFFMNPIEKWQARKKFPYKFVVQVIKIFLVTIQLCLFAHARYNHINYTWDNRIAFSHLFLKGWDASREVESYPPTGGPFALYEKSEFFAIIDYAIHGYAALNRSIGPYDYTTPDNQMAQLQLCVYNYREGTIFGFNESYIFNPEIQLHCELLSNVTSSEKYLEQQGVKINFSSLVKATLNFGIKTVNFKAYGGPLSAPDCFQFDISIIFDNSDHDGQMLLYLDTDATRLHCKGDTDFMSDVQFDEILRSTLNIFVILVCLMSFALCARAIYRAYLLRCQTVNFFREHFNRELSFDGRLEFINFWYIMILFNDVLLILGSALKEQIERKYLVVDQWDTCSFFLGIGNLLVWFGVLRYLGFFKTYNVVILTLKKAAPKIARFLLAALLIYAGFAFCGWLILGPYHMKFRSLATTSECLFSLINGDDMFATFATLSSKSRWLWFFCQVYLYSFISLYIYVVLSLFISVIMDAYDTIKRYYRDGFPVSDLREFVGTRTDEDITSGVFLDTMDDFDNSGLWGIFKCYFCCGGDTECINCPTTRRTNDTTGPSGYTSLTSIIK